MSVLRGLFPAREQRLVTGHPWLFSDAWGGPKSKTGVSVNANKLFGVSTAWACITLIADTISSMPVDVYRIRAGVREIVEPTPGFVREPSSIVPARLWRYQAIVSLLVWGKAIGFISGRDSNGFPIDVEWLDPEGVTVRQDSSLRKPTYLIGQRSVDEMQILHLRRWMRPGAADGMSPLEFNRETIGLAIAIRDFTSQWFADGAHPSSVLSTPQVISPEVAVTAKQRFWEAIHGKREPAVLGGGWKYEAVQSTPEDSQLAALRLQADIDICKLYRVPPEFLGLATGGSSVTYANREQRALDFLTFAIQPWLVTFEDMWTSNLPRPQFAKFNPGSILRTDVLTRYRAHDLAIRMGLASVNEERALEDRPPVENGDQLLWPPYRSALDPAADQEPTT